MNEYLKEGINFLQGEINQATGNIGSPAIPQPPGEPQPARPYGLPRWQTEPKNMIDDVMTRWTGPINTGQDYIAVKERLNYLEKYQPQLKGEIRIRCDTAIRLLKNRIDEYESRNLHEFLSKISEFAKKRIGSEQELVKAEEYLSDLTERAKGLSENYARAANSYMSRLKSLISDYRERHPERKKGLGLAGAKAEPTPEEEIPELLRPFWTWVLLKRGDNLEPVWKHTTDSVYCKIETVVPEKEWRLRFEDRDEAFGPTPDWDYNEPVLHIKKTDNRLEVKIEKYKGWGYSDIYYGDTLIWKDVGGMLNWHVGEKKTLALPEAVPPEVPKEKVSLAQTLKKYVPWIIGIVMVGGMVIALKKGKKK